MKYKTLTYISVIVLFFSTIFLLVHNSKLNFGIKNNDWLIVYNERIGPLFKNDLRNGNIFKKIQDTFGEENIKPTSFSIGEGENIDGFSIYPNSANEIKFYFDEKQILFKIPGYNSYFKTDDYLSKKSDWKTLDGIKPGSTLGDIEKINGKIFTLSGFEWDYPGVVLSWNGGRLPQEFSVVFIKTKDVFGESNKITGEVSIMSNNDILIMTQPIVNFMYVKWSLR